MFVLVMVVALGWVTFEIQAKETREYGNHRPPQSILEFDKLQLEKYPEKYMCYEVYVFDLIDAGRPTAAEAIARDEVARFPKVRSTALESLGNTLVAQGRYNEARDVYNHRIDWRAWKQ